MTTKVTTRCHWRIQCWRHSHRRMLLLLLVIMMMDGTQTADINVTMTSLHSRRTPPPTTMTVNYTRIRSRRAFSRSHTRPRFRHVWTCGTDLTAIVDLSFWRHNVDPPRRKKNIPVHGFLCGEMRAYLLEARTYSGQIPKLYHLSVCLYTKFSRNPCIIFRDMLLT